jgi:hypothetical protein
MSLTIKPMPAQTAVLKYSASFTRSEFATMQKGLVPERLDDKWLIICDGVTLFFHRSGTGHCIYKLVLEKKRGEYRAGLAVANRDPSEYTQKNDEYDVRMLHFIVRGILLGDSLDFPLTPQTRRSETLQTPSYAPPSPKKAWWKFWIC